MRKKRKRARGSRRWHFLYANVKIRELIENGDTYEVARTRRREFIREWGLLSLDARAEFEAEFLQVDLSSLSSEEDARTSWTWPDYLCDEKRKWPIAPAAVESMLRAKCTDGHGVVNRYRNSIRKEVEASYLLKDTTAAIPAELAFSNEVQCKALHHGLCITDDSLVYEQALVLAKFLERHFTKSLLHRHYCLSGSKDLPIVSVHHMFHRFCAAVAFVGRSHEPAIHSIWICISWNHAVSNNFTYIRPSWDSCGFNCTRAMHRVPCEFIRCAHMQTCPETRRCQRCVLRISRVQFLGLVAVASCVPVFGIGC
jgi:hypothetical protein